MKNKTVFIDMDGVISSYSCPDDTVIAHDFTEGFFINRKPVSVVIRQILLLFGNCHLAILSASPHNRAIIEKNAWLDKHFDISDRHFIKWKSGSKAEYILEYCAVNDINPKDIILIDDTHKVLEECELIGCQVYHPSRLLTLERADLK